MSSDRGDEPRHRGKHCECRHHNHATIALGEFGFVAAYSRQRGKGHALYRLHGRIYGHVFQLLRLIKTPQSVARIDFADKQRRDIVVQRRDKVGAHKSQTVRSHLAE